MRQLAIATSAQIVVLKKRFPSNWKVFTSPRGRKESCRPSFSAKPFSVTSAPLARSDSDAERVENTNNANDKHEEGEEEKEVGLRTANSSAANDFRTDSVTTPTASMLRAIQETSFGDDEFLEDETTLALEADMAALTGHEAGIFVTSGTMGNQIAARAHLTQPPHSILCDSRAHVLAYEVAGISLLSKPQSCLHRWATNDICRWPTLKNVSYSPTTKIRVQHVWYAWKIHFSA